MLLCLWAGLILIFFSISSSRIEYYSLPALPPLALLIGRTPGDLPGRTRIPGRFAGACGFMPGVSLGLLMLVPYMEKTCVDNRREFIGMFEQVQPLVYQAAPFLGGHLGRPDPGLLASPAPAQYRLPWRHRPDPVVLHFSEPVDPVTPSQRCLGRKNFARAGPAG